MNEQRPEMPVEKIARQLMDCGFSDSDFTVSGDSVLLTATGSKKADDKVSELEKAGLQVFQSAGKTIGPASVGPAQKRKKK
jgi:hypothetical protein